MSTSKQSLCADCNRSALSLALFRLSPIPKNESGWLVGSNAIQSDLELFAGLLPQRALTESRFGLRLLREGYVYVYIPKPPKGVKPWLIYRVTASGDLIAEGRALFSPTEVSAECSRAEHNRTGMKLLEIPQAHAISGSIWIAYSGNYWNEKLRQEGAANPEMMQEIKLSGGSPNTFKPTAEALANKVMECALGSYELGRSGNPEFPFCSLRAEVDALAKNLQRAAATHPSTAGKELAVVLRDPVGMAIELNAMRLIRSDKANQFLTSPANRQPIEVNKVIKLMRNNLLAKYDGDGISRFAPLCAKSDFDPAKNPPGTEWQAISAADRESLIKSIPDSIWMDIASFGASAVYRDRLARAKELGRVIYPDTDARAEAWAHAQAEKAWADMFEYYDEAKRSAWEAELQKQFQTRHLEPLRRFEEDWACVLADPAFKKYFARHFDETQTNLPLEVAKTGCCAGSVYQQEAARAMTPEPQTEAAKSFFEAQLDADVTKPDAILMRAVMANQASLWSILESDKRDKTYDFIKGLIGEFEEFRTAGGSSPPSPNFAKRVAWLNDANMGFSLGIAGTLSAVALRGVTVFWQQHTELQGALRSAPKVAPELLARLSRAEAMMLIHRVCESALSAKGGAVKVPLLLTANVSVETFVQIKRARGEMLSKRELRGLARKGQVRLAILTDTDTVARLRATPDQVMHDIARQEGSVIRINEQALKLKDYALSQASSGGMLTLPIARFIPLYEQQLLEVNKAPALFRGWLQQLGKAGQEIAGHGAVQSLGRASFSTEGRLAVGTMIVQGVGAWKGITEYMATTDTDKRIDALLSIADGAAGVLGGAAEFTGAWVTARLGQDLAEKSVGLAFSRAMAAGMGAAGNIVNAWMCFREAGRLEKSGEVRLANVMARGGGLFLFGGVPLALQFAHQLAVLAIRRGATSGALLFVEGQLGRIVAARLGSAALGLAVPGVGWVLTVVAVGHTVYVVMNTPTPVQRWLKACYFGKPDDDQSVRKNWDEEDRAWKDLQKDAG